jgi:D-sedoheptulose 7-phosphate isomerase
MNSITKHFADVVEAINFQDIGEVEKAVAMLREAKKRRATVWICGNGGSAATAAHFANDLVKMAGLRAIDVSGLTPITLACGNDHGWDRMFINVIHQMAEPLDVIFLISCSGNSENIVCIPPELNLRCDVIGLTGPEGGKLAGMYESGYVACLMKAVAEDIKAQEDMHLVICHAIAGALCE